jgi:F-type H+-transporting ATPase subunit gamma
MAKTTTLKHRIGSNRNIRQITRAMQFVAASKMRRAQENAFKSRDYRTLASEILSRLRQLTDVSKHPLFAERPIKARLVVMLTSDRGLAGAYNSNLMREFTAQALADQKAGVATKVIVVGTRGAQQLTHIKDIEILAAYEHFPERPTANDISPILNSVVDLFQTKAVDAVDVLFTDFKSSITQIVKTERLLPAAFQDVAIPEDLAEATFEPSPDKVLNTITLQLIEAEFRQDFLEAQASEQSMRMLAMKNATDNASDLIDDLTLAFNTARQAAITQEIAEITGGAEAIAA